MRSRHAWLGKRWEIDHPYFLVHTHQEALHTTRAWQAFFCLGADSLCATNQRRESKTPLKCNSVAPVLDDSVWLRIFYPKCGTILQRLFSSFPTGWPGSGLVLLRLLVGGASAYGVGASVTAEPHWEVAAPQILEVTLGVSLLAGFWTPLSGSLLAIVEAWIAFSRPGKPWMMPLTLAVLGASLAMIGPGGWSVDALLFGRKQINPGV